MTMELLMAYQKSSTDTHAARLRKEAGAFLKKTRQAADLSGSQIAELTGLRTRQTVSQVENGWMRLPEQHLESWSRAVKIDPGYLAKRLLAYYEPITFKLIFHDDRTTKRQEKLKRHVKEPAF